MAGALIAAEPFAVGAFGASQPANTGAATITISLPSVTITDPLGGNRAASLGQVALTAQSYPSLAAALDVGALSAMGQAVPGHSYSSNQGGQSGNVTVPISTGPVTGSVGVTNYALQAANGGATASVHALSGTLNVAPLGLGASIGTHGVSATVGPSGSGTSIDLASPGLSLNLANLLPSNVLNGLPLGALLSLAQSLGLNLSPTLAEAAGQVKSLVTTIQTLDTNLTNLSNAQSQVASLSAANSAVQSAQQAVTTAQQGVSTAQANLTSAQSTLGTDQSALSAAQTAAAPACNIAIPLLTCPSLQAAVTAAQSKVTADQSAVTAAQTALTTAQSTLSAAQTALTSALAAASAPGTPLATAQALVASLTSTINGLLSQLQSQLGGLPNLQNLLAQVASAIGGAPLINVANLDLGITTTADSGLGRASVSCSLGSLSVLGVAVPSPSCTGLGSLIPGIQSKLAGVLAALPVSTTPVVSVSGPQPTSSGVTNPTASHATSSTAGISALHLGIAPLSLNGLVDQLTAQLKAQVSQLLSSLGISGAATSRSTGLVGPAAVTGVTLPTGLTGTLTTLSTQVSALPTGSALQGLSTIGLDAVLPSLTSQSTFQAAGSPSPASPPSAGTSAPTPGSSSTPPAPGASPTPGGTLAATGANELAGLATGLLLIVIGAQLMVFRLMSLRQVPALVRVRSRRR